MFVSSNPHAESSFSHDEDIWKSSDESTKFCFSAANDNTGLRGPFDSDTYCTTRSLSECCVDKCTSLSHNVHLSCSEVNGTPVCLSTLRSTQQNEQQQLPVAIMSASQSSLSVSTLAVPSPGELSAGHLSSDTKIPEMHTTLPSSAVCYHSFDII